MPKPEGAIMRKVIFQMMVSLDGYFEGPNREIDWHVVEEEFNAYASDLLDSVDLLVFGRVTYQLMAGYWPTPHAIENDPVIASKMNALPKLVFSRKLDHVGWNNARLVKTNPAGELARLKQLPGKDIAIFGSSDLALTFIENNLIDEFRIFVAPVVLGAGKPLFKGINGKLDLKLAKTMTLKSGVAGLFYTAK